MANKTNNKLDPLAPPDLADINFEQLACLYDAVNRMLDSLWAIRDQPRVDTSQPAGAWMDVHIETLSEFETKIMEEAKKRPRVSTEDDKSRNHIVIGYHTKYGAEVDELSLLLLELSQWERKAA